MKKYLLIGLFAFELFGEPLGLNIMVAPRLSIENVLLGVMLGIIILQASVASTEFRIEMASLHFVFIALIAYMTMSWAISAAGYVEIDYPIVGSFISLKATAIDRYLFMIVFFYALTTRDQVLYVVRAVVWIVLFSSILALIDYANLPDLGLFADDTEEGRALGPIGQPNRYGGFLAFWIPVCVGAFLSDRAVARVFLGLGILCSISLLILTGSRGALVGIAAGSMLAIVFLRHHLPARLVVRGAVAAAVVAAAILLVVGLQFTAVVESRLDRTTSGDVTTASAGRIEIWSETLSKMSENPGSFVYGNGWDAFDLVMDKSAHNMYLNLFFELGGIGLALYLVLLIITIRIIRAGIEFAEGSVRTQMIAVIFAICAISVSTVFSEVNRTWFMIWAYTGLILRLALISQAEARNSELQTLAPSH